MKQHDSNFNEHWKLAMFDSVGIQNTYTTRVYKQISGIKHYEKPSNFETDLL